MLFWNFAQFYPQRVSDTLSVSLIGLQAVADMSDFDFPRCIAKCAGGVCKESPIG
jgi:hypothetical protein